jgi:hypothetical protein
MILSAISIFKGNKADHRKYSDKTINASNYGKEDNENEDKTIK